MATKRTTGKRAAPKSGAAQKNKLFRQQMAAVIAFAVGLLLTFLALVSGLNVWNALHKFLFGLFGLAAYLVGPLVVYISGSSALKKRSIVKPMLLGALFLAFLCGAIQLLFAPELLGNNFFDKFLNLYAMGAAKRGGGLAFCLLGWPLLSMFGKTGAVLTMGIAAFVILMFISGKTLLDLHQSVQKPVRQAKEMVAERMQRGAANIDVDIGGPRPIDIPLGPDEERPAPRRKKEKAAPALPPQEPEEALPLPDPARRQEDEDALDALVQKIVNGGAPAPQKEELDPAEIFTFTAPDIKPASAVVPGGEEEAPASEGEGEEGEPFAAPEEEEEEAPAYNYPSVGLLDPPPAENNRDISRELKQNGERLVDTLKSFGVQTKIINISRGPAVTRYELQPNAGVKISKITNLADDIALNLAASGVRIEAPIPNKAAVGIEVPNKNTSVVGIREMLDSPAFRDAGSALSVALGKDIAGNVKVADIGKMPHVLIAGATGSGKSVCINSIILSLLYKSSPEEVRLLMVDPKVVELGVYNGIPHLLVPVVTDPHKAAGALGWAVTEMLNRYKLFAANNVRDLGGYNKLCESRGEKPLYRIVIIIDELADLMMAAPGEVEDSICRLAQMARAAGMHLIIATQRPSVDVITGVIKANIPSRIAFAVSSQVDSRTILDGAGAEKLLGRGDMLYFPVGASKPTRIQGCFVTDEEIERVVEAIKPDTPKTYDEQIIEEIDKQAAAEKGKGSSGGSGEEGDDMLPDAIEVAVDAGQISTSMLQRKLKLGYARAARIVDEMEERGIIGPFEGSKPRKVLISRQQWLEMCANQDALEH